MAAIMESVADGITRLGTTMHNFYLIEEGGKFTVIDAGCSKELPTLVRALERLGGTLDDVEALLVTHAHADHFGFAKEAQDKGVELRIHEDDVDRATGTFGGKALSPADLPWWQPGTIKFLFVLARVGVTKMPHVDSIESMRDGETLELPGKPTVIHTPGHTPGHAMFNLPDRRILFTGDGLVTMNVLGGADGPQMMADPFHSDPDEAFASVERLAYLEDTLILPGHGAGWRGDMTDVVATIKAG